MITYKNAILDLAFVVQIVFYGLLLPQIGYHEYSLPPKDLRGGLSEIEKSEQFNFK